MCQHHILPCVEEWFLNFRLFSYKVMKYSLCEYIYSHSVHLLKIMREHPTQFVEEYQDLRVSYETIS